MVPFLCCGDSLRNQVKYIAGIQIGGSILVFIGLLAALFCGTFTPPLYEPTDTNDAIVKLRKVFTDDSDNSSSKMNMSQSDGMDSYYIFTSYELYKLYWIWDWVEFQRPLCMIYYSFYELFVLMVGIELWNGAHKGNYWRCNIWFRIQLARLSVFGCVLPFLLGLAVKNYNLPFNDYKHGKYFGIIKVCLSMMLQIVEGYFAWIVYIYMKKLKTSTSNLSINMSN